MRLSRCSCVFIRTVFTATISSGVLYGSQAWAATLKVCSSGCSYVDLQDALEAAQPGDTILLRAGETFVGNFRLPLKANPSGAYILIRSDAADSTLPAAGKRLIPIGNPGGNTDLATLPRLIGKGGAWKTTPVLEAAPGAHHYRLRFLNIDGAAQEGWETLVEFGNNSSEQSSLDTVPQNITLDRVYIHGHPIRGQKRCLSLNGRNLEVHNSYIVSCMSFSYDAQAIAAFNGPGPFKIVNNYLEGSGENVMFGGADPKIFGLVPSEIQIRRNHFSKPLAWRDPILKTPNAPSLSVTTGGALGAGTRYVKVVALIEVASDVGHSVPSPERAVSVAQKGSALKVTWGAVPGADRYRVYVGTSPGGQNRYMETPGSQTSLTYTGGSGEVSESPASWGTRWVVKNLLELKNAQRVIIDGNVFEQLWPAAQQGYAILFTPRNDDGTAPWTIVREVTFSNNILRHTSGGIVILGDDDLQPSQQTRGITIRNNLVYDLSDAWGGTSHFLVLTRSPREIKLDHNSIFHDGMVVLVGDGPVSGFEFTNNVMPHNEYGIFGSSAGTGFGAINMYFPDVILKRNAFGGGPEALYPPDNFFPDLSTFWAQFVDPGSNDFRLAPNSIFHGVATEGGDLGVDFVKLNAAVKGVVSGGGGPGDGGSTPFSGTPVLLPGKIEAENFDNGSTGVAYADSTASNLGGQYRDTAVDIELTSDVNGGYDITWTDQGEWLKYTVQVKTSGTYTLGFRVAAPSAGGTFHLEVDGVDVTGPVTIPNTGGWQIWRTVKKPGVTLSAGTQVWRLIFDAEGPAGVMGNLNYIRVRRVQ
jgi:hypothetical protein